MTILALDLGTATGWATNAYGVVTFGTQSFAPGRFEGGGMRYLKFQRWLDDMQIQSKFGLVSFEEVRRHAATDAAHAYGGFLATLTSWCEAQKIPYMAVPVGTIKKSSAGKGNASKAEVIAAVEAKGYTPKNDNEADAIALLLWMIKNAPASPIDRRPAPDSPAARRVPVATLPVARRRIKA